MAITRRSIVKGAAWAAPVIAVSTAVPAYAASRARYEFTGSVQASQVSTTAGCMPQEAKYSQINLTTSVPVDGAPAGFAIRALPDSNAAETPVTLNKYELKVAFSAGVTTEITVTSGDYVVSGPLYMGRGIDIYTFTYVGPKNGTTISAGATAPSWPGSILETNVVFNSNVCRSEMTKWEVQKTISYTTENGYNETYTTPWTVRSFA